MFFLLFTPSEQLEAFKCYLNYNHVNVSLTIEGKKLATSLYRKPTFGGFDAHFENIFF